MLLTTAITTSRLLGRRMTTMSKRFLIPHKSMTMDLKRAASSTGSPSLSDRLVDTKLIPDVGIAEITMQNGPVNSLSLEM
jgi:hypothetical protein